MTFLEILEEYNVDTAPEGHRHAHAGWVQFDCPFCGEESEKYHMGYSLTSKHINCWKCGYHRVIDTLMALTGQPFQKVKEWFGELKPEEFVAPTRGKLVLPKGIGPLAHAHKNYLRGRGFRPNKLARLWGLQGIGIAPKLQWRIFIPIHHQGEVVSWTTRKIRDSGLRYHAAKPEEEAVSAKSLLYGEDYCRHSIIVVEGHPDVWAIGPGAAATGGTGFTQAQVLRISKYPTRVICFDSEEKAQQIARELCDSLAIYPGTTYNVTLTGKDASRSPKAEIQRLREMFL